MENQSYNNMTHREAAQYHEDMRSAVYEFVENEFTSLGITLKPITIKDAKTADQWKDIWKKERKATWIWQDLYHTYQSRSAIRRLDIAVFKNSILIGLVYGMLDRGRLVLKVHAMESNPSDNLIAGKMLKITLFAAEAYANLNDTPEIWLCDPVSPAHIRLYKSQGYEPYYDHWDRCTHLARKLK